MRVIITFLISISFVLSLYSQNNYSVLNIENDLKENANAVVRNHNISIEINSLDEMIISEMRVITILNRFGDKYANTYEHYDDTRKILKMSLLVLDKWGKEIKKVKYSDFDDVSAVSGGQMYTDNRMKFFDYKPLEYPYTIVYESKYKEKSTAFINGWYPLDGYYLSVEKSSYKLSNKTNYSSSAIIIVEIFDQY